jgi:molybdate transport system permease protein
VKSERERPAVARGEPDRLSLEAWQGALLLPALALFCFLITPLFALLWRAIPGLTVGSLVLDALQLSLSTTLVTTGISVLVGTPTACLLARYRFPGRNLLNTLVDLPMVLPPAVAGLALLMAFGRRGLLGGALEAMGISLPFSTAAVVVAQTFVAAPFYIRGARVGLAAVDRRLEQMAATLGLGRWEIFWRVTVPLAGRSLLGGAIMTWARALGEFGATIMFAGNFQGKTQTMPLAIYIGLQDDLDGALALAAILLVVSFSMLVVVRLLTGRGVADD